jgi:hypothetical protein
VKIEENPMIQTTRGLIGEVEKTGDIGETAGPLEFLWFIRAYVENPDPLKTGQAK